MERLFTVFSRSEQDRIGSLADKDFLWGGGKGILDGFKRPGGGGGGLLRMTAWQLDCGRRLRACKKRGAAR